MMIPTIKKYCLLKRDMKQESHKRHLEKKAIERESQLLRQARRNDEYKVFTDLFIEIYGESAYTNIEKQVRSVMSKRGLKSPANRDFTEDESGNIFDKLKVWG